MGTSAESCSLSPLAGVAWVGLVRRPLFYTRGNNMTTKVACPECGQTYKIKQKQLGKKANCKSCGERFVLQVITVPPTTDKPVVQQTTAIAPPPLPDKPSPEPEQPKGFLARMKAKASEVIETAKEKDAATAHAKLISGISDVPKDGAISMKGDGGDLTVLTGFTGSTEVFRLPLKSILSLEITGTEELTLHLSESKSLVLTKILGSSIDSISEKITAWMKDAGVLSDEEAEDQNAAVTNALTHNRDEEKAYRKSELTVQFVSGSFNILAETSLYFRNEGSDLVANRLDGFTGREEAFRVPLESISLLEATGTEELTLHFRSGAPLVFEETSGSSLVGISDQLILWMGEGDVLSDEEAKNQLLTVQTQITHLRSEEKRYRESEMYVNYLHGPYDTKPNTTMFLRIEGAELIARTLVGFSGRENAFQIPLEAIKGTEIETTERMTVLRTVLLGIYAFGMKKKDKLLRIDYDDGGTDSSIVVGKGAGIEMEEVSGRILSARREHLKSIGKTAIQTEKETPAGTSTHDTVDIAETIKKLAELKEQGLLTEEEYSAKKAELLDRI